MVSDTDDQQIIVHIDSIPFRDRNGLRLSFDLTMVTIINERVKTLTQELQQKLDPTSFWQIMITVQKGQGSYAPHMYPSRKQQQKNFKQSLQKLQGFAKRTRSQAMVPSAKTPQLNIPKQKLSYQDILKISQSPLAEREATKQALLNKKSSYLSSYQSPRQQKQNNLPSPSPLSHTPSISNVENQTMISTQTQQSGQLEMSKTLKKLQQMEEQSQNDSHLFRQAFISMGQNLNHMHELLQDHRQIIQVLCQNTMGVNGKPLLSQAIMEKLNTTPISPTMKLLQTSTNSQDHQNLSLSTLNDLSRSCVKLKNGIN